MLEDLLESGCFYGSGKFFDGTGISNDELEVMQQMQQQGWLGKVWDPERHHQQRYQLTSQASSLFEVAGKPRLSSLSKPFVVIYRVV